MSITSSVSGEDQETICYIQADKPLVYNFFDAKSLSELVDKEPTSGRRKQNKKKDSNEEKTDAEKEANEKKNEEEELKIKKLKNEANEIYEGKIRDDVNEARGKKFNETQNTINKIEKKRREKKSKNKI